MEQTPIALRKHVSIFGNTNAGKSSLFNAILGQEVVIVSDHEGTTTDPIIKAMELIPFGPITLIDTAGLNDISEVGVKRIQKTKMILDRTDLALYVADITSFNENEYAQFISSLQKKSIPHILTFTKCDKTSENRNKFFKEKYQDAVFTSHTDEKSIFILKERINHELKKLKDEDETIIGNLLPKNSVVVMVVPIDSAAPKGRLILPQVQLLRDCLDHGIKCFVTRETELSEALSEIQKVDLVVTDSQAFKIVNEIVPPHIPLTSFSMLLANQKGNIQLLIDGIEKINLLPNNAKILMAEGCTHNRTHEDIGRVKIPALLQKHIGKKLNFEFYTGYDFPENLEVYDLVVHCGGCMLNKKTIHSRLSTCKDKNISVTNYGVLLAYLNGILPRCGEIFHKIQRGRYSDD